MSLRFEARGNKFLHLEVLQFQGVHEEPPQQPVRFEANAVIDLLHHQLVIAHVLIAAVPRQPHAAGKYAPQNLLQTLELAMVLGHLGRAEEEQILSRRAGEKLADLLHYAASQRFFIVNFVGLAPNQNYWQRS